MFSPIARCWYCTDEYDPVEFVTVPQDPEEPQFCSDTCEASYYRAEDGGAAYDEASTGAPVY